MANGYLSRTLSVATTTPPALITQRQRPSGSALPERSLTCASIRLVRGRVLAASLLPFGRIHWVVIVCPFFGSVPKTK